MSGQDRPFRILALDGGGMRGLYSATVLDSFAKHFAARRDVDELDVGRGFDLITGTSTGGIVACALAFGLSTSNVVELFRSVGPRVFRRPIPDSLWAFLGWAVRHLRHAANSDKELRGALERKLGEATLESVFDDRGIALCIPAVNMSTGRSLVFKTPHHPRLKRDRKHRLVDVCLSEVVRVPHTSPSREQIAHMGLDRASPDSLRALSDLGRQDGDFDQTALFWGETGRVLADMFECMPATGQEMPTDERRAVARRPKHILVAPGVWLKDESREGAGFLTHGPAPRKGSRFAYTVGTRASSGHVRWIRPSRGGAARFGVEKASSDA